MQDFRALFLLLAFLCASCTSFQQSKVSNIDELNVDVPKDIENKYEVKDSQEPKKVPAPEPTKKVASKSAKGAKVSKKVEKDAEEDDEEEEFAPRSATVPILHEGEHYLFDITYFGAVAGQLDIQVLPSKYIDGRKAFHVRGAARTASVFNLFYRLNDVVESYIDADSLFSYRFLMKLDETLQIRDIFELYDQHAHTVYFYSKWDRKKKGMSTEKFSGSIEPFTQDSMSAFFYVRTLPLEIGKPYRFPVCTNGKMKTVQVTAVRKENLVTKVGTFPAIVVKPEVVLDGVLQTNGDTYMWYSDDKNRNLLKVDAKIKVGSIIAYLHDLNPGNDTNVNLAKP